MQYTVILESLFHIIILQYSRLKQNKLVDQPFHTLFYCLGLDLHLWARLYGGDCDSYHHGPFHEFPWYEWMSEISIFSFYSLQVNV